MWETVAQLKCLLLMGRTLPCCVGKRVFVYFCVATMTILSASPFFSLFPLPHSVSPIPSFFFLSLPFLTTSKGLFVSSVANRSSSLQT